MPDPGSLRRPIPDPSDARSRIPPTPDPGPLRRSIPDPSDARSRITFEPINGDEVMFPEGVTIFDYNLKRKLIRY